MDWKLIQTINIDSYKQPTLQIIELISIEQEIPKEWNSTLPTIWIGPLCNSKQYNPKRGDCLITPPNSTQIHPLGWHFTISSFEFIWVSEKHTFQDTAWNQFHICDSIQSKTDAISIPPCPFLNPGFGTLNHQFIYRVGSTHSGRFLSIHQNNINFTIVQNIEFSVFEKTILYPLETEIQLWHKKPSFLSSFDLFQKWLIQAPFLITDPITIYQEWCQKYGKEYGILPYRNSEIYWTTQIKAENLLGIQSMTTWDWTPAQRTGFQLIIGENSAGKSSWLDVWTFCLWGTTARSRPRGILRLGFDIGIVEIIIESNTNTRKKIRREIYKKEHAYQTKLWFYEWDTKMNIWKFYEGRHQRGETNIKGEQKRIQADIEDCVGTFQQAKETSLLGADGLDECWNRTSGEWERTFTKLIWENRNQQKKEFKEEKNIEESDKVQPLRQYTNELSKWLSEEGYILVQSSTSTFYTSQQEIMSQLSPFINQIHTPVKNDPKIELEQWIHHGILREWLQQLTQIIHTYWPNHVKIDWNHESGFQFHYLGGQTKIETEMKMTCRWERMMIVECWRMIAYFMIREAGHSMIADVWLDEEWDGVDPEHGLLLYQTFGHWSGTHVLITHQDHWKQRIRPIFEIKSFL